MWNVRTPRGEAREVRARANVSVGVVRGPSVKYRFQPTLDDAIKNDREPTILWQEFWACNGENTNRDTNKCHRFRELKDFSKE